VRLLPVPQAIADAEKEYRQIDNQRERNEMIDEVHRLTKVGVSAQTIADLVGMSERQVQRIRSVDAPPKRWYSFEMSERRCDKLERTADAAIDLACRLRDEDPQLVFRSLELLDRHALQELTMVALAGLPLNRSKDDLFGWVTTNDEVAS
jgi:hypothetical protein